MGVALLFSLWRFSSTFQQPAEAAASSSDVIREGRPADEEDLDLTHSHEAPAAAGLFAFAGRGGKTRRAKLCLLMV